MKKVKLYKGYSVYQRSQRELHKAVTENLRVCEFEIYLQDESPSEFCSPEWEADSLQECIDFLADR